MFRRLIMVIFRLYMKYLLSSYTKYTWAVFMGQGGGKSGHEILYLSQSLGGVLYRVIEKDGRDLKPL